MALWAVQATATAWDAPQFIRDDQGRTVPILVLDDQTGLWYCGGVNKSQTWTPGGSNGLVLVVPTPTGDPRVFTLPSVPKLLMLFLGGALQLQGEGNDFVLDGVQITFGVTPGAGANIQAVVG